MTHKHKGALSKSNHEVGDCWELCNTASDDILLDGDTVENTKDLRRMRAV